MIFAEYSFFAIYHHQPPKVAECLPVLRQMYRSAHFTAEPFTSKVFGMYNGLTLKKRGIM